MKKLILVKHSLPEIMEDVPAREWELSDKGRALTELLADRLRQYRPEVIISSTEPKARQTAEIISANLGLTSHAIDGLHEHDRSHSPFYPQETFQARVREFFDKPNELIFGDETANQALARFRDSINAILRNHADKNLVVVSHGTVMSLFVSWLTGTDGCLLWQELGLPSFVVLDIQSKLLLKTENIS